MDLYITISDENGDVLDNINIYQNGSDVEGANAIREWIENNYTVEGQDKEEEEGYPGQLTLEQALEIKVGDTVTAPSIGLYKATTILEFKRDPDERVQLLFKAEGHPHWFNFRHVRTFKRHD